ncbi:pectinesterase family protein [Massilia niabensis]|uniref:Pectinesterase family protein n=1 Tax=Massilia niabensis TaxID=544910 RepID=A0ABW0LB01_9BURK
MKLIAALFGTALWTHALAAPGCPGAAVWCDGFDDGAARWTATNGRAAPVREGTGDQVLRLEPDSTLASRDSVAPAAQPYFVEARMRPLGAAGQSYLLARYVDERNWIGAGIDVTPGSPKVNLVIAKMQGGKLTRLKQWGKESLPEKAFYTVRLALAGDELTLYLNGERLTSATEPLMTSGRIGLLTQGAAFELDDVRLGAPDALPGRIGLARMNNRVALQAGDAPLRLLVNADGRRPVAVAAMSSDPSVASAVIDGDALVVTAHRAGQATVGVASSADRNVAAWLGVSVGPRFAPPVRAYPAAERFSPAAGAAQVPVDTVLRIRFDRPPVLGAGGSVRIFRAADDALVDVINVGDELDVMGARRQAFKRVVRRKLVKIEGDSVVIRPHSSRLVYDSGYYVQVDPGVLKDAVLGGVPFTGLGGRRHWSFRTRAALPQGAVLSVDGDGPADFRTVQGALNHAMGQLPRAAPVTIRVANGRYDELLYLNGKDRVTLLGESRDGVVIGTSNDDGTNAGSGSGQGPVSPGASGGRAVFLVEDADLLTLDTLTLVNTARRAGSLGAQAEALNFNSGGRLVARNASFWSEQDTIQVKGYSWFYRSLIAGNVDFIWGGNRAALFEESEIRSLGDSANAQSGGYVVQARTLGASDPGFVFLNSRLTHGPGPAQNDVPPGTTWLARPGTPQSHDKVIYINCRMDAHIAPAGWSLPKSAHAGAGAGWREYGSMDMHGAPLDLSGRVGGRTLTAAQVAAGFANRAQVFAGFDNGRGWNPQLQDNQ